MKLTLEAQNICGHISTFLLIGLEPASAEPVRQEHEGGNGSRHIAIPIFSDAHVERWNRAITINLESVQPGTIIRQEVELEYDPRHLRWVTIKKLCSHFFVHHLRWGEHDLMIQPGPLLGATLVDGL